MFSSDFISQCNLKLTRPSRLSCLLCLESHHPTGDESEPEVLVISSFLNLTDSMLYKVVLTFKSVTIQMKAIEQYFHVVIEIRLGTLGNERLVSSLNKLCTCCHPKPITF